MSELLKLEPWQCHDYIRQALIELLAKCRHDRESDPVGIQGTWGNGRSGWEPIRCERIDFSVELDAPRDSRGPEDIFYPLGDPTVQLEYCRTARHCEVLIDRAIRGEEVPPDARFLFENMRELFGSFDGKDIPSVADLKAQLAVWLDRELFYDREDRGHAVGNMPANFRGSP